MRPHFLTPLLVRDASRATLRNARTGRLLAATIETAFDSASRRRGLLGRDCLPTGHALVIAPSNLVHTFGMGFQIDLVFVARNGQVLKVRHNVPPRRIAGALRGFAVVEMAAGEGAASDTRPGDMIEIVI